MSMKTPNYTLIDDFTIYYSDHDQKILEKGTFIRPVQYEYVPKHVIDDPMWRHFKKERDVFCYTRWGFVAIPQTHLRET